MSEYPRVPQLRLLVGIDLTERSRNAFSRAVQLASASGGSVALVHVTSELLPQKLLAAHDGYARDVLEEHVLKARADGVAQVEQSIVYGRDYEQLIEQAKKDRSDLIVVGRHRSSSVLQDMLGTTVDRVLRLGGIPVLAVRRKAGGPYNSILVAADFSPASRRALEMQKFTRLRLRMKGPCRSSSSRNPQIQMRPRESRARRPGLSAVRAPRLARRYARCAEPPKLARHRARFPRTIEPISRSIMPTLSTGPFTTPSPG